MVGRFTASSSQFANKHGVSYFRQVRVDEQSRTIVWPNGLDPDPDMLHDNYRAAEPVTAHASDPA